LLFDNSGIGHARRSHALNCEQNTDARFCGQETEMLNKNCKLSFGGKGDKAKGSITRVLALPQTPEEFTAFWTAHLGEGATVNALALKRYIVELQDDYRGTLQEMHQAGKSATEIGAAFDVFAAEYTWSPREKGAPRGPRTVTVKGVSKSDQALLSKFSPEFLAKLRDAKINIEGMQS
jgi:hypothetical protein